MRDAADDIFLKVKLNRERVTCDMRYLCGESESALKIRFFEKEKYSPVLPMDTWSCTVQSNKRLSRNRTAKQ